MSAQPAIVPTTHPRWTPVVVEGSGGLDATVDAGDARDVDAGLADGPTGPRRLAPPTRAAAWRRRAAAVALPLALAVALVGLFGPGTADAGPTDPVAGTATVEPGQTLWDLAAATAPDGTDTRDQLARIVALNGFDQDEVQPWTVVLLPAR